MYAVMLLSNYLCMQMNVEAEIGILARDILSQSSNMAASRAGT